MANTTKRSNTFLLRLPLSIKEEAVRCSRVDGTSLNHFISLALAEKITRLEVMPKAPGDSGAARPNTPNSSGFLLRKTS